MQTAGDFLAKLALLDSDIDSWTIEERLYIASALRRLSGRLENAHPDRKVRLIGYGSNSGIYNIELIKWVRKVSGFGLKESKGLVDNLAQTPFELYVPPEDLATLISRDLAQIA